MKIQLQRCHPLRCRLSGFSDGALELNSLYKASHAILMYRHQVRRNHWPGALARGKGSTKDNAFNTENITRSIRACRTVDLLIDSGASLGQNNEGTIFSPKQLSYLLYSLWSPGLCGSFFLPILKSTLSGGKKKISCHLYMLMNKISASQIFMTKDPLKTSTFVKHNKNKLLENEI